MASTGDFSDAAKEEFLAEGLLHDSIFDETKGEKPDLPYLEMGFECVRDNLPEIDGKIEKASEKWTVERMSNVDLAILRVAVAELLYIDEIEDSVAVNEAVLMAKKYGSEKSSVFINGILGTIVRSKGEGGP